MQKPIENITVNVPVPIEMLFESGINPADRLVCYAEEDRIIIASPEDDDEDCPCRCPRCGRACCV